MAFGIGHLGTRAVIQGGQTNDFNRPQKFTNETWGFDADGLYWSPTWVSRPQQVVSGNLQAH